MLFADDITVYVHNDSIDDDTTVYVHNDSIDDDTTVYVHNDSIDDDTTVYVHNDSIDDAIQIFITELSKVASWFYSNKLPLNVNNTQMIMFSQKNT